MKRPLRYLLVAVIILVIVVFAIIMFITFLNNGITPRPGHVFSVGEGGKKTPLSLNELGDAMGGMAAPVIGILSTILIFYSFQEQYRANTLLVNANKADKIKDNLKEYLERIEKKISDLPPSSEFDGVTQYQRCIVSQRSIILHKRKMEKDKDYKVMANLIGSKITEHQISIQNNHALISSVESIVDSSHFYAKYLLALMEQKFSDEIYDTINFYFREFNDFCEVKLDRLLTIKNIPTGLEYQDDVEVIHSLIRTKEVLDKINRKNEKTAYWIGVFLLRTQHKDLWDKRWKIKGKEFIAEINKRNKEG